MVRQHQTTMSKAVVSSRKPGRNNKVRPDPTKRGRGESDGVSDGNGRAAKPAPATAMKSPLAATKVIKVYASGMTPCFTGLELEVPRDVEQSQLTGIVAAIVDQTGAVCFNTHCDEVFNLEVEVVKQYAGPVSSFCVKRDGNGDWLVTEK